MYEDYAISNYSTSVESATGILAVFASIGLFVYLFSLAISVFLLICNWKVYVKAGQEGWKSLIPIYNVVVLLQIVGLPTWYLLLFLVPFANIYVAIKINLELARKFGKTTGFAIGLIFLQPIFMAILAFDKSIVYENGQSQQPTPNQQMAPNPQAQSNVKYCQNCGTPNNAFVNFCQKCGKQI